MSVLNVCPEHLDMFTYLFRMFLMLVSRVPIIYLYVSSGFDLCS
jgi:hypothetical protein